MQKKTKIMIILAAVLAVLLAAAIIIPSLISDRTSEGEKEITFTVVYPGGNKKDIKIETDALYLADALYEQKLITEAEYEAGYYTVIDGIEASWNEDNAWWCITKDGVMTTVGMNEQAIEDGDKFEATYTKG